MYAHAYSPSKQRFYSAFYQWTVLLSRPQPCLALFTSQRLLHSSAVRRAESQLIRKQHGASSHRSTFPNANDERDGPGSNDGQSRKLQSSGAGGKKKIKRTQHKHVDQASEDQPLPAQRVDDRWDEAKVMATTEKPFDTLEPWEEVLRHRTSTLIMLQMAVPLDALDQLRLKHGNEGAIKNRFGPDMELGQTNTKSDAYGNAIQVRSLLLSGTYKQVGQICRRLRILRGLEKDPDVRPAKEITNVHSKFPLAKASLWKRKGRAIPFLDYQRGVISYSEQSARDLDVWDCTIRERSTDDKFTIQIVAPTKQWDAMRELRPLSGNPDKRFGIMLRAEAMSDRPGFTSLLAQGTSPSLNSFTKSLVSLRSRAEQLHHEEHSTSTDTIAEQQPAHDDKAEHRVDIEDMKLALRPLSHSVVVITARHGKRVAAHSESSAALLSLCRGVTVSSFNSVSLSPRVIVSFNLKLPSRTWDAIMESGSFHIHTLTATPAGAAIAHAFTQPSDRPEEPFLRLARAGYPMFIRHSRAPKFGFRTEGVSALFVAELDREKCVEIGDHAIVVAEVIKVQLRLHEQQGTMQGLAYAMQGYRGYGSGVAPAELVDVVPADSHLAGWAVNDVDDKGTSDDMKGTAVESKSRLGEASSADSRLHFEKEHSADETALEGTNTDAELDDYGVDAAAELSSTEPHDMSRVEGSNIDSSEFATEAFFEEMERAPIDSEDVGGDVVLPASAREEPQVDRDDVQERQATPEAQRGVEAQRQAKLDERTVTDGSRAADDVASSAESSAFSSSIRGPRHGTAGAWGVEPTLKSSFSTLATTRSRSYSSKARTSDPPPDIQSQLSDPSLASTTFADFFGEPIGVPVRRPRMLGMMRATKAAYDASRTLEKLLAKGVLTPKESRRLETVVVTNERRVARRVAQTSAYDLRNMLDTGRIVDYPRVQWLESSVEKGLAVLLAEAKQLREALDQKWITPEAFQKLKTTLEEEHTILNNEVTRLRQMADEDWEDGGLGAPPQSQDSGKKSFDGFRGNR